MHVVTAGDVISPALRGAIAALGNFDGFHCGHQAVVGAATRMAAARAAPLAVLTFDPHPAILFRPDAPPFALASLPQKLDHLRDFGVDLVIVLRFDRDLAAISAPAFVNDVLHAQFQLSGLVCGYDFTFGQNRAGTTAALTELGARHAMTVDVVPPVAAPLGTGQLVSSSRIREKLASGAPRDAARLMGRWWRLRGDVAHGDKRGRTIGYPTANIALGSYVRPLSGVYAVRVYGAGERAIDGVANIGARPTVDGTDERLEVHLLDFAGDLYGKTLDVEIVEFIRAEQKFSGLDTLKAQIAVDAATALKILRQPAYGAARMKSKNRAYFATPLLQDTAALKMHQI